MFEVLKPTRGDLFSISTALSRPLSSCHARLKLGNSKCCIFKATHTTGLKICKTIFLGHLQPSVEKKFRRPDKTEFKILYDVTCKPRNRGEGSGEGGCKNGD